MIKNIKNFDKDSSKKLLFSLTIFHSIILQRRKFGAIGFSYNYDWMNSDFNISYNTL